jgi:hypothetical protein
MLAAAVALAEPPKPVTTVTVTNPTAKTLKHVPVTFGQVFGPGDLKAGPAVHVNGKRVNAQVDVKRTYDHESIRFAVVSLILPEIAPEGRVRLELSNEKGPAVGGVPAPVGLDDLLKKEFDARVELKLPEGKVVSADAAELLEAADSEAARWLEGPLCTEWLVDGPLTGPDGRPDPDLHARFQVRAYRGGPIRVSVCVENCWDTWGGFVRYDAKVTVNGRRVFARKDVSHRRLSRWRKVFWTGGRQAVEIAHEPAYLVGTGAVPHYDVTLDVEAHKKVDLAGDRFQIMGRGYLTHYMPTTGGRPEIGAYPRWAVEYLLTQDPGRKELTLLNGDLAGSWPVHVRARETGRILSVDRRPKFWLDPRGRQGHKPEWKPNRFQPPGDRKRRLYPDIAHQPSLAYLPYLATGDYYYLEEAYFWANYCLIACNPAYSGEDDRSICGQVRGKAWALRNIADAATIAPSDHPEGAYFADKIGNSLRVWTRVTLGPPEYSKLGFWGLRSVRNARIKGAANPQWMVMVPWEFDYLIWSLHHADELGFDKAGGVRDYLLRWRVGTLTHAPDFDPNRAAQYRMVVAEKNPETGKINWYDTWARLHAENKRLYPKAGLPAYGGGYGYSARAAVVCGVDAGFPKGREALKVIHELLPKHRQTLAGSPTWAIIPGGVEASQEQASPQGSPGIRR